MLNLGHTRTMPWHGLARERTLPRRQMALGGGYTREGHQLLAAEKTPHLFNWELAAASEM